MTTSAAFCSTCGAAASGAFCSSCGARIGQATSPVPPPPGYAANVGFNYQAPRATSGLAVGAIIAAFLFAPAGLVLGIMAKREIARTGADGDGLATAAIVVSAIAMLVSVIAIVAFVHAAGSVSNNLGPGPNGF
jgi:hypothetical protein